MITSLAKCRNGNVAVLFGLAAPVIAGIAAIAVDYSDASRVRASLAATADAAALAGARALDGRSDATGGAAEAQAALYVAQKHPDAAHRIAVSVARGQVAVDLSVQRRGLFGTLLAKQSMPIAVHAVAVNGTRPAPCMLAVGADEPVGIGMIGSAKISAAKCAVASNSKGVDSIYLQGAAKLNAYQVCATGGTGKAHTSPPPENCPETADPYVGKALRPDTSRSERSPDGVTSTYTGPCDYTDKSLNVRDRGTTELSPGIYCGGLSIHSADARMKPGLYIMQDGPLSLQGNATLQGPEVSILLSGVNAILDMQGSPKLTLSAMSSGPLAGMAIASDTPTSPILTSTLQGSPDLVVTGSIYLPHQRLEMQGSPLLNLLGQADTLIALSFRLQGSPDINIASDHTTMASAPSGVWLIE